MKKKLKILIVEDDSSVAEYIKTLLEDFLEGIIKIVDNGKDAISQTFIDTPDLILMDIVLNGDMDGIETSRQIQKNHDIPIVYMTANDDVMLLEKAKITDPFGYMLKPIQYRELQAIITITLQQYNNKSLLKHDTYISKSLQKIYHPLIITDIDGNITSINEASANMFSLDENTIINKSVNDILNIKIFDKKITFNEELVKLLNNNGLYKQEEAVSISLPNGGAVPISITYSMINNDLGENDGVCIMLVDLTQQTIEKNLLHKKQLEAAELLIKERVLKEVLDIGKDINQTLIYSNDIEERLHTVVNRIVQFGNFKIAHIALKNDLGLETIASSKNSLLYLNYPNEIPNSDSFLNRLYSSLKTRRIDLWEKREGTFPTLFNHRVNNIPISSILILPLCSSKDSEIIGVMSIASSDENAFDIDIINYFEEFANDIAVAITLQRHRDEIENLKQQRENNYEQTILSFVQMIEERDIYTKGHSERVAKYSKAIAEKMDLNEEEISILYRAGILHDIGKIQTPDKILLKPGILNKNEYQIVQEHVESSVRMLKHIDMYKDIAKVIKEHHELYDGSGYPQGLKSNNISLMARIMCVADSFDAMTTSRIYRKRFTKEEAINELIARSGIHFDPKVIKVAIKVFDTFEIPDISQVIETDIETERMAYFFRDNLTQFYNEDYLNYYNQNFFDCLEKKSIFIYEVSGLRDYNKKYNWYEGNKIIRDIASIISDFFDDSKSICFRIHGNKFLILSTLESFDKSKLEKQLEELLINTDLYLKFKSSNLKEDKQKCLNENFEKYIHNMIS
jgi:putative nucleotidyltransferase with HDIG domain